MSELVEALERAINAEPDVYWAMERGQRIPNAALERILSVIEGRVRAEERERAARIAEAFSRDMFERCAASGWNDDEASCLGWHGKNIAAAIRSGDAG